MGQEAKTISLPSAAGRQSLGTRKERERTQYTPAEVQRRGKQRDQSLVCSPGGAVSRGDTVRDEEKASRVEKTHRREIKEVEARDIGVILPVVRLLDERSRPAVRPRDLSNKRRSQRKAARDEDALYSLELTFRRSRTDGPDPRERGASPRVVARKALMMPESLRREGRSKQTRKVYREISASSPLPSHLIGQSEREVVGETFGRVGGVNLDQRMIERGRG